MRCWNRYPVDEEEVASFLALKDAQALSAWLNERGRAAR